MSNIYLSVIIPVYNTEKYLKKCLDSVVNATKNVEKKIEIIVINDGSKGNCDEIVENYKEVENFIYISQENKGRGATRNVGLEASHGDYVTFVDSDDYIDSNMYKDMLKDIEKYDICVCDIESMDEMGGKLLLIPGKNPNIEDTYLGVFDVMMMPSCVNKIFKKSLFTNVSFPSNINYEDLATIPEVMLKAQNIKYIPNVYYYYVQNTESIMNQKYGVEKLNIIKALEIVFSKIDKLNIEEEKKEMAKYSLFTRRYYEEILERIMLSKDNKEELIDAFVDISNIVIKEMQNNKFWNKDMKTQSIFKRYFNAKLFRYILDRNTIEINKLLQNKKYYRRIAIIYSSNGIR